MRIMKVFSLIVLLALGVGCDGLKTKMQDKTITKVVKLLQGMLEKSTEEGDTETKIFAKFKCYCDQSEAEKNENIASNTKTIDLLESKVAELQVSNGEKSSQCASLKASMEDNEAARQTAEALRKKQNKAFKGEKQDLTDAIAQMKSAIQTLTAVGADQTLGSNADSAQFMAGKSASLISLQSTVKSALSAAEAFMTEKQASSVASFIQAPFTGTYSSQSGAVMGIIKNMRDTFEANLATAIATEKSEMDAHNKLMKVKKDAWDDMKELYSGAQESLGDNDEELSSTRKQLAEAVKSKAEDEEFLEKLLPMCKAKTDEYNHRKMMRANEEVAVAEAISILNSDAAFATFGTTDATSTGATSFVQVSSHPFNTDDVRAVMQRLLRRAQKEEGHAAPRLTHVISALQAENPFDEVLGEIDKMIDVIEEEGKADKEKLDWCNKERTENNKDLKKKKASILSLDGQINTLEKTIGDPVTGLKKQISNTETSLLENEDGQKQETAERAEANRAYQTDVKNLAAAQALLKNAMKVLNAYYDQIDKSFLQSYEAEDPAPPKTFEGNYKGQSEQGGGVIKMLKFILKEAADEEAEAHKAEESAQHGYEDSMAALKKEEAEKQSTLAKLQDTLAKKEEDLLQAQEDHKATTEDKESIEESLESMKAGCDFITSNFKLRNKNRATEKTALNKATSTLKASPAYKAAESEATVESYGDCKKPCVKDAANVKCKACRADVTVPAYCAGHKGTPGC
jgi:hypothetical protein